MELRAPQVCEGPLPTGLIPSPRNGRALTRRSGMALRIVCTCGYVIRGDDGEELWRDAQRHMGVLHPELVGNVTRDDILAQSERL